MDDDTKDQFDDLFEPFELEESPSEQALDEPPPAPVATDVPTVPCPSCGSINPAHNRHCEQCGARLSQSALPVAPEPMLRTTAGARALMVLAGVILAVALGALLVNLFRDSSSEPEVAGGDNGGVTVESSVPVPMIEELPVASVEASSELEGFEAENLIDDDPTNRWNDTQQGGDVFLTFTFPQPVQITQMTLQNVTDEAAFVRNRKIRDYQIEIDDVATITSGTLANDNSAAQTIDVNSVRTTRLTLKVITTWPAESYEGDLPFKELALQEVQFFGQVVDDTPAGDTGGDADTDA